MELIDALLELIAPLAPGDELAPGTRFVRASCELGLRLTFADDAGEVHVEVFPAEPARPRAARSESFAFAYRSARAALEVDRRRGQALCRAVAERARQNEDRVLEALRAREERDAPVRELRGGRLLEPAGSRDEPYYSLSPYVGCLIGCRYCYAQERVDVARALRGLPARAWGSFVDARVDAPELLREELRSLPARPIKLCPIVSDPYHAIEARLQLTRACLAVLAEAELAEAARAGVAARPILVLSRAKMIERDLGLFLRLRAAEIGMSIPTCDEGVARFFEPRAASIDERFATLRRLRAAGVRTFAVVQPLLPGPLEPLADRLAEVAESVSLDVLRGEQGAGALFDAYPEARGEGWQRERAEALSEALRARGVPLWEGELSPRARAFA